MTFNQPTSLGQLAVSRGSNSLVLGWSHGFSLRQVLKRDSSQAPLMGYGVAFLELQRLDQMSKEQAVYEKVM